MLSLAAILRRFPAMPRVMRRALLAPLALSCFAHAATPRAASRDISSASRSAGSAARANNATITAPWDSWGGGGGVVPGALPRCLATQAQNYCRETDPVVTASAQYKFTQTFTDAELRPGEHEPDGVSYGLPHYTVTFEAAAHTFHNAIEPMAVYGYNGKFPGDTFVTEQFKPIIVEWVNKLPNDHIFLVDPFIPHTPASGGLDNVLPNPPLGMNAEIAGPDGLRGGRGSQGRGVVHLHGGHQPDYVDGEPEAWFNPIDAPQVMGAPSVGAEFCASTYKYPNIRAAGTLWYHDHVIAMTRQNVFAGLAGFYLLRPKDFTSLAFESLFPGVYDFPLVLQDRTFTDVPGTGICLCYATAPNQNDLQLGLWQPEWAGQVAVINGKIWPVMTVAQRPYRFRLLDGTNARVFNLYIEAVGGDDVAVCRAALGWYQIGVEGGLYTASRDIPASGLLLGIAERPEVVLDFGDAPLGCVFELRNNAPVPFTGIYPAPELDTAPLPELIQFKVARAADSGRDAAKGWELAGGLSAPGSSAAQRRQVVDSALMLQNGGIAEGLRTNLLLTAIDAAEPPVPPSPSVVHQPASPQLAAALTALDALPPCAMSAADANDDALLLPPLCLRRTVLFEQMACPAALPSPGGGIPPLPLIGPLAGAPTYGPAGVRCANPDPAGRCPNTAETYINSDYATCEPMVPLRVLLGTASIDADGRIAPFVPPEGYESPPTEYVGQRVDPVTGQLIRQEVWDFINWSVDAHPMHVHEASLRVLGRYVVPILPDQDGGVAGYVDQDSELDCANAYWQPAAWHELHAVKDVTLVNPSPVYAMPGLVPPSNPTDIYPPGSSTTYEQFVAENARPFAPFTESFRPKCAPLTRALFAFEDYPGRFVWHCHLLEHEDNDMMRPLRICAPPGFKALGVADDACLRPKCISPATAVAYDVRNGFSAI